MSDQGTKKTLYIKYLSCKPDREFAIAKLDFYHNDLGWTVMICYPDGFVQTMNESDVFYFNKLFNKVTFLSKKEYDVAKILIS